MSLLDFMVELEVDCPDSDANDVAFVWATTTIGGHDAVEEFVACRVYPLLALFGFGDVSVGMTIVSKVETPLPVFPVEAISTEASSHFLATVEMNAKKILGSYGPREHEVCMAVKLPSGGHLNRVFEQIGVSYALRPLPGTEAFMAATKKRKADVSKKTPTKKAEVVVTP
jgi:hypothetical protein